MESPNFDGHWVYNIREDRCGILIDRRLPIQVQRYVYLHELLHGVHELIDIMLEEFPEHVMTKSMYKWKHPEWEEPDGVCDSVGGAPEVAGDSAGRD